MKRLLFVFVAIVSCWGRIAFVEPAAAAPVPQVAMPQQSPKELPEILARLASIQTALTDLKEKLGKTPLLPILFPFLSSLLGVGVGAGIAVWSLTKNLAHQERLAADKAKQERDLTQMKSGLDIGNSFAQWQLRQLSELYGPLRALLLQSNALYRHMNAVLVKKRPDKFQLRDATPDEDFDRKVFDIFDQGGWTRFRTVLHLNEVYGQGYGIEDYFDEIVKIGGRLAKVISEQAGYARPGSEELLSKLGEYLAHYSVLERLHGQVKAKLSDGGATGGNEMMVDGSAAFPYEIHRLVDADFKAINKELSEWRTRFQAPLSATPVVTNDARSN